MDFSLGEIGCRRRASIRSWRLVGDDGRGRESFTCRVVGDEERRLTGILYMRDVALVGMVTCDKEAERMDSG
jgi:hypothetical protein